MKNIRSILIIIFDSLIACGVFVFSLVFGFDWLTNQVKKVIKEKKLSEISNKDGFLYESEQIPLEMR